MKYNLILSQKKQLTNTIWEFSFNTERPIRWQAGQYMEWFLPHSHPDKRGTRRFFTLASSPTEKELMITTKITDNPSTFKTALRDLNIGNSISARDIDGDFVLSKDRQEKIVFIAGGIGITPFRAMVKYLLDTGEKRDIILLYSNINKSDTAYMDLFNLTPKVGLITVYYYTKDKGENNQSQIYGYITPEEIQIRIPDWQERTFYVSGPEPMVESFEKMLKKMGIKSRYIKTDYFPGYV